MDILKLKEAGLTEGEAKVYLSLLELGSTTSGPILKKSGVANSIIYRILDSLIGKGLVSFIINEKTKYFHAEEPQRILDYLNEKKKKIEDAQDSINLLLPSLILLKDSKPESSVKMYKGFKGLQTAWETYFSKLKKGEEYHSWGVYPVQDDKYHIYWNKMLKKQEKLGIKGKILFNKGTSIDILKNRNNYKGMDVRYMPTNIKTPAWFIVYKNVVGIFLQSKESLVVQIFNQEIADTYEAYFQDLWGKSSLIS